ncbi:hypothetical protein EMIT0P218_20386 [Pseudomonas sp. IT-P218]
MGDRHLSCLSRRGRCREAVVARRRTQGLINTRSPCGAAAGCDLLIFASKNKIKRSQPRCTRQLLQGNVSDESRIGKCRVRPYNVLRNFMQPGQSQSYIVCRLARHSEVFSHVVTAPQRHRRSFLTGR